MLFRSRPAQPTGSTLATGQHKVSEAVPLTPGRSGMVDHAPITEEQPSSSDFFRCSGIPAIPVSSGPSSDTSRDKPARKKSKKKKSGRRARRSSSDSDGSSERPRRGKRPRGEDLVSKAEFLQAFQSISASLSALSTGRHAAPQAAPDLASIVGHGWLAQGQLDPPHTQGPPCDHARAHPSMATEARTPLTSHGPMIQQQWDTLTVHADSMSGLLSAGNNARAQPASHCLTARSQREIPHTISRAPDSPPSGPAPGPPVVMPGPHAPPTSHGSTAHAGPEIGRAHV